MNKKLSLIKTKEVADALLDTHNTIDFLMGGLGEPECQKKNRNNLTLFPTVSWASLFMRLGKLADVPDVAVDPERHARGRVYQTEFARTVYPAMADAIAVKARREQKQQCAASFSDDELRQVLVEAKVS
jgi:hypothetical protein